MSTVGEFSATSKRCLAEDAPRLAAILPAWTQASEAVQEILRDYDEVCQQLAKPETGPELERDLRRIRKELISELARATGDPAGDNCSVGSSQKEEKNSDF